MLRSRRGDDPSRGRLGYAESVRWFTARFLVLAFASTSLGLAGCTEETGLSVDGVCAAVCDFTMACDDTVTPVNEDNYLAACLTQCRDDHADLEADNPDDSQCHQAFREWYQCVSSEATCSDIASDYTEVCNHEGLDIYEYCDVFPFA